MYRDGIFAEQKSGGGAKLLWVGPTGMSGLAWTTSNTQELTSAPALNTGQWHRVAFVREGDFERFYADGSLVQSRDLRTMPPVLPIANATAPRMTIVAFQFIATDPIAWRPSFLGMLDWLWVTGDADYAGSEYDVPTVEPTADATTLLLFTFNEAPGSTIAHDSGPSHFDGTLRIGYFANPTSPAFVPEPASLGLIGCGVMAFLARRGRR